MKPEIASLLKTLQIHVPQISDNPKRIKGTFIWRAYHFSLGVIPIILLGVSSYMYLHKTAEIATEAMAINGAYEKQMIWNTTDESIIERLRPPGMLARQFFDYRLTGKRGRYSKYLKLNHRVRDYRNIKSELEDIVAATKKIKV